MHVLFFTYEHVCVCVKLREQKDNACSQHSSLPLAMSRSASAKKHGNLFPPQEKETSLQTNRYFAHPPHPKVENFTLTPCCTRNICCFLCPPTKMHLKNAFLSPNLLECILAIGTHLVFSDAFNALTNQFGISRQKCLGRRSLEISSLKMFRLQCRLF